MKSMRDAQIRSAEVACYTIPTDTPEADGTFRWNETTLVTVHIEAGTCTGWGYTYADNSTASLAYDLLTKYVLGESALDIARVQTALVRGVRNLGREGIAAMSISAINNALWDAKAKLLDVPLASLLGRVRDRIEVYGSGGFTTYSDEQLRAQIEQWASLGIRKMKMKIGSEPDRDLSRVRVAREAAPKRVELFVDANGAYSRKQALWFAQRFIDLGVTWFEEPVSSDDLAGLHLIRDNAPAGLDIAAGEYGYTSTYFLRMLQAQSVDVLQADATRCCGISGFLNATAVADAENIPMSAHCAPYLHVAPCCAAGRLRHIEYFHDHARIAHMIFDGVRQPVDGYLSPDLTRPGHGFELKRPDAARFLKHSYAA